MAATPSIKVRKHMAYRGGTKEWSNRYHFDGGSPGSSAAWTTLADAVVAAEKLLYDGSVQIDQVTGYDAGSDVPVFTKAYAQNGTAAFTDATPCPGDVALLVKYTTTQRTRKNHPIYLFNYYHAANRLTGGAYDLPSAQQKTAVHTYAAAWIAGFSDGSVTHHRAGPNGAVAQAVVDETYLTHRDFPR